MDRARYIAALVFVGLAALVAVGNWLGLILAVRRQKRGDPHAFSFVFLVSIVLSGAAYASGYDSLGLRAWLPALIDPPTWALVCLPVILAKQRRRPPFDSK